MKGVLSCLLALVLVFSITPSVFAEGTAGGKTIYVDAKNGDDEQEKVGTASDKAYKTVAAAVAAANSGDTIQLGEGNYTLYDVSSKRLAEGKDLTFVGAGTKKRPGTSAHWKMTHIVRVMETSASREQRHSFSGI